jgi:tetratricopeptide (TPR) repeat protein
VAKSSLVTLIGPPRSGKTSLVEAGLVPRLKQGSTDTAWDVRLDFPATSTILAAQRDPDGPAPRVLLVSTAVAFAAYIERGDAAIQPTPAGWSLTASGDPMASVLILAETEEQVLACERVARANATRVEMTALSEQELAAAVTEPAFGAGLTVESGLAKRIAADVKNVRQPLPLLQYALTQLWAREPRGILTMQKYEAMGGVHVAERLCAAVFASLSAEDQTRCLRALTRLIFVPQTGPAIPQPAPEASIPGADRVALDAFLSAGILVRGREENSQAVWLRFADAIFLDGFPRVQAQVDEKRDFLLWRQRLARNLSAWQANRRSFTLLSGAQLAEAVRQAAAHSEELNEQERAYIAESSAAAEAVVEQRSSSQLRQKRTSYGWAVAGALTLLVSGMYFYNSHQKNALFENLVSAGARLASSGDFQGALEQYQKASAIRPSDAQVATATGTLYASLGRPKDALQAFDKAINHAPTDIDALPRRGDVNAQLGLIQAALDDWLKTLTVSPGDQRTKLDLGQILDKKPGQTTVIFYDQGVADAALRNELAGKLQQAGFQVQQRPYGIAQPPNVVWYAADVPAERWQTVARLLLESKVVLRQTKQQPDLGSLNIQIGYSAEAANQPPLTMKDL